jgi:hypothetical protein
LLATWLLVCSHRNDPRGQGEIERLRLQKEGARDKVLKVTDLKHLADITHKVEQFLAVTIRIKEKALNVLNIPFCKEITYISLQDGNPIQALNHGLMIVGIHLNQLRGQKVLTGAGQ